MDMGYKYIRAWGRMLYSDPYYIAGQIEQARKDKAPKDAIYYDPDKGIWRTFSDITNNTTIRILEKMLDA